MKLSVYCSLLLLGLCSSLVSAEQPPAEEELPAKQNEEAEDGQVEEMRPAWLGVFGEKAGESLMTQLGVDGGLVLRTVIEQSPAGKAGLKVNDLLLSINGEAIGSQDELKAAVAGHKAGDEIKVGVVSRGVRSEKAVKLVERPEAPVPLADLPKVQGDKLPRLRVEIDELMFQMEGQRKQGGKGKARAMGSVKMMDGEGSVEMKLVDEGQEVKVRDKAGKLLYEGPWDNDQDKAAAPPEVRERIENLNIGGKGKGGGFQLRIGPGGNLEGDLKLELHNGGKAPKKDDEDDELE